MLPLAPSPDALAERLSALTDWLEQGRARWGSRPFTEQPAAWEAAFPDLARGLRALDPAAVEAAEASLASRPELPAPLHDWIATSEQLCRVSAFPGSPAPGARPRAVPGRKWSQINAFLGPVLALNPREPLDWCAGKGHLGRTLGAALGRAGWAVERDPVLAAQGAALAAQRGVALHFEIRDVLQPEVEDLLGPRRALIGLHACGDLSQRALSLAVTRGCAAVALAPCCYNRVQRAVYQPLSRLGQARDLGLSKDLLRLPCAEEVVASARLSRLRRAGLVYRAALNHLLNEARGEAVYHPFPNAPEAWVNAGPQAYLAQAAARYGLDIDLRPAATEAALRWGQRWVQQARALGLARIPYRRPLELWILLDRALFLTEAGWRVQLGTFCARELTPRNLALIGQRPA